MPEKMIVNDPVTQTPAAKSSGADARRERAIRTLRDAAFEVLLAALEPQRTTDLARAVAERCGLATDEQSVGLVAPLVRMVLDSDPAFAHTARQWNLAAREGQGQADRRRPVERTIEELIQAIGKPSAAHEVAPLIAAIYGRDAEYYSSMIERMAPTRPQFFVAPFGRVGLTRWLLDLSSEEPLEVELDNFDTAEELALARAAAAKLAAGTDEWRGPLEYAQAVIEAADVPLTNRALTYVVWERWHDIEPLALFNDLLVTDVNALRPGPLWESARAREADRAAIRELAGSPELAQSAVAAVAPVEEAVVTTSAPQTVGDEDVEQVYEFMSRDLRTYRLSELCQEVLESFPGSRSYPAVRDALFNRMRSDHRFVWAGTERFRLDGTMPDSIDALPPELALAEPAALDEEGEPVDKLLPLDRWKHLLEEQVKDPLLQTLNDDDTRPAEVPERVRIAIPMRHYVEGTLYVRHQDRPFFPLEPDFVSLVFSLPDGGRQEVWLNNRLGIIYGLKEWYDANLPWTGGVFYLERADQPDEYRLIYTGEVEPALDIPMERLQTLLQLRALAEADSLSLTEILTRMLKGQPAGIPFARLFEEANVVRRSRRALIASVLSGHRGFQQKPEQPGAWLFDERRAEKAARKGGRPKRIREYEEEDDLEDE
jgi:hypothetical protein